MGDVDREFMLERYRYILEQKKFLNKTSLLVVSIFQAGLGLILAGRYQIQVALSDGGVSAAFASVASFGLSFLLWVLALFSILLLGGGVVSWIGYRRDEAEIERAYLGGGRPLPVFADALKWYETYIALGIIAITLVFSFVLARLGGAT